MPDWVMPLFAIVVAVALFLEMLIVAAVYVALRHFVQRIEQVGDYIEGQFLPLISRLQLRLDEVHPRISSVVREGSELMYSARKQAERTDRIISETADHISTKLAYADRSITEALETIEHTRARIRQTVLGPMRSIEALTTGIQTGINVYRTRCLQSAKPIGWSEDWISPQARGHSNRWPNEQR